MFTVLLILLLILQTCNALFTLSVSILNYITLPSLNVFNKSEGVVSVLIPARNEERNIARAVKSCLSQSENIEIIVYDDNSSDSTAQIVRDLIHENNSLSTLKLISGQELPSDWLGKPHACYQLGKAAIGDYLCFIDADVELIDKEAISKVKYYQKTHKTDLLSLFPEQKAVSLAERIIIPLIDVMLYSYLPIDLANRTKAWQVTAANGQFIFFKKSAYQELGGHELVKNEILEDMRLAQRTKRLGYKVHTQSGKGIVRCRMYENFKEILLGFGKNYFSAVGNSLNFSLIFVLFMLLLFFSPHILVLFYPLFLIPLSLQFINRLIIAVKFNHPIFFSLITTGVGYLFIVAIAIFSTFWHKLGKPVWKNRVVK
jgi:chlorobactene glucosyltransferase